MKESIKQKISRTHKKLGTKPPSNLGKKFSEEHKRRLSKSHKNIKHSKETIVKIPANVEYEIDDYDGMESIHEKHKSWG